MALPDGNFDGTNDEVLWLIQGCFQPNGTSSREKWNGFVLMIDAFVRVGTDESERGLWGLCLGTVEEDGISSCCDLPNHDDDLAEMEIWTGGALCPTI